MTRRQDNIPKAEKIDLFDRTLDTTVTVMRPYVQLAKGAIIGAFWGGYDSWVEASKYRAMQREMEKIDINDFCEAPKDAP